MEGERGGEMIERGCDGGRGRGGGDDREGVMEGERGEGR